MKTYIKYIWTAFFLLALGSVNAAVGKQAEIQHLLKFVESSQCTFLRNGSSHDSINARSHIEMKYNHVKSRVDSTEDFIKYAATRSSLSGKQYEVVCNGKRHATGNWLLLELLRFRQRKM